MAAPCTININMQIREMIELLEKIGVENAKLDRSAFLYLEQIVPTTQFAQCATCSLFLPGKQRCAIFGEDDVVKANASCGLYIQGVPSDDQEIRGVVTPEQAGYVNGQVRCQNCLWYNAEPSTCGLFEDLNKAMPSVWDLEEKVLAKACCNGWQPKSA